MINSCKLCHKETENGNKYCPSCHAGFLADIKVNYSRYALKAGIPPFYHSVSFADMDIDDRNHQAIEAAKKIVNSGGFLLLYGDTGVGKTWIATAAAREIIMAGHKVYFSRAIDFFRAVRKGYKDIKTDASDILQGYKKLDFLILDDLGSEKFTEWIEETVYDVINFRHGSMLPTLITSNMNNAQISEKYGARVARRIAQAGPRIELTGKDRSK